MIIETMFLYAKDFIINQLFNNISIEWLIDFVSNFEIVLGYFKEVLSWAYFFLPVDYLTPLFAVVFGVVFIRIFISLINMIIRFVPLW